MILFVTNTLKYLALLAGIVALTWGSLHVWQKDRNNEIELNAYSKEYLQQQAANAKQQKKNDELREQIRGLAVGTPEVLEEQARETLNMTKEGETFFTVPEERHPSEKVSN